MTKRKRRKSTLRKNTLRKKDTLRKKKSKKKKNYSRKKKNYSRKRNNILRKIRGGGGRVLLPDYFKNPLKHHPKILKERESAKSLPPTEAVAVLANIPSRKYMKEQWIKSVMSRHKIDKGQASAKVDKMSKRPPGAGMWVEAGMEEALSGIDLAFYVLSDERLRPAYEEFHYNNDNGILEAEVGGYELYAKLPEDYEERQKLFVDVFESLSLFRQYYGIFPIKGEAMYLTPYEFLKLKELTMDGASLRHRINYLKKEEGHYERFDSDNPNRGNAMNDAQANQVIHSMELICSPEMIERRGWGKKREREIPAEVLKDKPVISAEGQQKQQLVSPPAPLPAAAAPPPAAAALAPQPAAAALTPQPAAAARRRGRDMVTEEELETMLSNSRLEGWQKDAMREHMKYSRENVPPAEASEHISEMINGLEPKQLDDLARNLPKVALRLEAGLDKDYVARPNLTPGDAVGGLVDKMNKLSTVYFIVSQSKKNEREFLKLIDAPMRGKHPHYSEFLLRFMRYSVDKVTGKQVNR